MTGDARGGILAGWKGRARHGDGRIGKRADGSQGRGMRGDCGLLVEAAVAGAAAAAVAAVAAAVAAAAVAGRAALPVGGRVPSRTPARAAAVAAAVTTGGGVVGTFRVPATP